MGHRRHWNIGLVHVIRLDLQHHNRRHVDHGCRRWSDVTDQRSRGRVGHEGIGATFSATGAGAVLATNSTTGAKRTCSTITTGASTTGVVTHIGETGSAGRGDPTSNQSTVSAKSHTARWSSSQTRGSLGTLTRLDFRNLDDVFDGQHLKNLHALDDWHRQFLEGREGQVRFGSQIFVHCCWHCTYGRSWRKVYGRSWSNLLVHLSWRGVGLRRSTGRGARRRPHTTTVMQGRSELYGDGHPLVAKPRAETSLPHASWRHQRGHSWATTEVCEKANTRHGHS